MKWFHKLRIWWWNKQSYYLINDYAYWLIRVSNRKLGLETGTVQEAKDTRDKIKQKMDDLHEKRNRYAYEHNLKPHPNAPDNWREKYEQESTAGNGSLNGRSHDVGQQDHQ